MKNTAMPQTQAQSQQSYAPTVDTPSDTPSAAQDDAQIDVQVAAAPAITTWSFPRQQGLTVGGSNKVTLTNRTDTPMIVRLDRFQADLKGRDMLTLRLDPNRRQTLEFEAPNGGEAEGFVVQHDLDSPWSVPSIGARADLSFKGPDTFALLSHPKSTLVVEWLAAGIQRETIEPGAANNAFFSREEAKNMGVAGLRNVLGKGSAEGLICSMKEKDGQTD